MNKKLSFIESGFPEAPALESELCELITHAQYEKVERLCFDIAQVVRDKFPDTQHMVVTDINPVLALAKGTTKEFLAKIKSKKFPLSPDGLVVMQNNLNPASIGSASLKFLGNMPSWQQSAFARKDKSPLFNVTAKSSITQLKSFYRDERDFELMSEEALVDLISASGFSFKNLDTWGGYSDDFISHELVFKACFEVLGVKAHILKQVKGEPVNYQEYLGFKNVKKCEKAAGFLLKCLSRQPFQSQISGHLLKACAYIKMNDLFVNDTPVPRYSFIEGVGFGASSGFFASTLDYFCLTLSQFSRAKPERIFAEVIEGIIGGEAKGYKLYREGENTQLPIHSCSRELAKKDLMAEAFLALRWSHPMLADIHPHAKKQILTDELGL